MTLFITLFWFWERDDFVDKVFAGVGLKLERVPVGSNFSEVAQKFFLLK